MSTCEQRETFHGRKWVVARRVQNVQFVSFAADTVNLQDNVYMTSLVKSKQYI